MPDPTDTDSEGTGDDPTTSPSSTDQPTTTSISETMEPTAPTSSPTSDPTGDPSGDPTGETTGPGVVCGDGEVEGDEVCDDGVNDGAYGGCMADCSALAEHCGDSTINGPEVCDDGVNDDSYGGCGGDCTVLGPHCGDGTVQNAEEMCDNGAANENGSGCNVDCVISGTLLHEYTRELDEYCGSPTWPVFRADDNVLTSVGVCGNIFTFLELSPELEEVAATDALLAGYPYRATMRGTDWILAEWACNWVVAEDGTLTEICDDTRNTGADAIKAIDDESYIAMKNGSVAQFGAGSPAAGDSPDWTGVGNADGSGYYYDTYYATTGALGSVVTAGTYGYNGGSQWYYYGYIERFNSTGLLLTSRTYSELDSIYGVASDPDGVIYFYGWDGESSTYRVIRVNSNLNVTWNVQGCSNYISSMVVDNAGHVVLECEGVWPNRYLRKLDEDGNELWATDLEFDFDPTSGRLGIDSNDNIVRVAVAYDSLNSQYILGVEKFAP